MVLAIGHTLRAHQALGRPDALSGFFEVIARSTSQSSTRVGMLTTLARRSRGPAAQRLRGIAHPKKWPSMWRRAYPRSSPDARPPQSAASTKPYANCSASKPPAALMFTIRESFGTACTFRGCD